MSSSAPDIPLQFMRPEMKYAVMNWLVTLGLPARITHGVLQNWGEAMGVEISPSDYAMIDKHLIARVVEPRPAQG